MVRLPPEQRALLEVWSREAYPNEACGVLVGDRTGVEVSVQHVVRGRNLEETHPQARFELDPVAIVTAAAESRDLELEVVGIWHSHPGRSPYPSAEDHRGVWYGWSQVIVGVEHDGTTSFYSS